MIVQSLPFPNPRCLLPRLAAVGILLALISVAPALAATVTNAAPAVSPATNALSTPSVPSAPAKSDDEDGSAHSFKLNINTDHDDKQESLTAQFLDNLIPLAGIAGAFGTPILIVFFVCYFNYRRRRENVALAREYLEKGLPVPPELLDPAQRAAYDRAKGGNSHDLRRGFRLTFIGLAVIAALYVDNPHTTTWGWGLIPTIMGIGFLLSGWYEERRAGQAPYPVDKQLPPGDPR